MSDAEDSRSILLKLRVKCRRLGFVLDFVQLVGERGEPAEPELHEQEAHHQERENAKRATASLRCGMEFVH